MCDFIHISPYSSGPVIYGKYQKVLFWSEHFALSLNTCFFQLLRSIMAVTLAFCKFLRKKMYLLFSVEKFWSLSRTKKVISIKRWRFARIPYNNLHFLWKPAKFWRCNSIIGLWKKHPLHWVSTISCHAMHPELVKNKLSTESGRVISSSSPVSYLTFLAIWYFMVNNNNT